MSSRVTSFSFWADRSVAMALSFEVAELPAVLRPVLPRSRDQARGQVVAPHDGYPPISHAVIVPLLLNLVDVRYSTPRLLERITRTYVSAMRLSIEQYGALMKNVKGISW